MAEPGSRAMWALFEPVHLVVYFSEHTRSAFRDVGLKGFWRGYFAGRSAPVGPVPPSLITALFFGFAPRMVEESLPAVWEVITPEVALRVRRESAAATLRAVPAWKDETVERAADLACEAVEASVIDGRALGAANAALTAHGWPDDPTERLWQAATTLRELRGDGHVAALVAHQLSGLDSVVLRAGLDVDPQLQQSARGWTDEEWQGKRTELGERGLADEHGRTSEAGWSLLREVEKLTNDLAGQPWRALGPGRTKQFEEAIRPFSEAAATALPPSTPLGSLTADGPWRRPPA